VWIVLVAALLTAATDVTDRQTRTVALPQGKAVSIDVTIGNVRIDGWDKDVAEVVVERRAPSTPQLMRVPLTIDDTPSRLAITARQSDGATDPAYRADVTVRLPRATLIELIQIVEGRLSVNGVSGSITASVRRGPIDGKDISGAVRLSCEIGSITMSNATLVDTGVLRLRTFNGDIKLSLTATPANARIMALALNGTIRSDIPLTTKDTWGPRWSEATLGKGEPVISLDVVNGQIEIKSTVER
jgi:hypothetical protein